MRGYIAPTDNNMFCGDAAMNGFPSLNRITIWAEDKNDFSKSWQIIICMKPKKYIQHTVSLLIMKNL